MKTVLLIFISVVYIIHFTGCAKKTTIKAVRSPKVLDKSIKDIAIVKFKNDTISQTEQLNSALSNVKFHNKRYFNLIDRDNLDKILDEQKLNDSGLVKLKDDYTMNGLEQLQTLIVGSVDNIDLSSSRYYEKRTNYDRCIEYKYNKKGKKYCVKYEKYSVLCRSSLYSVDTSIKIIKIENSKILFAKTYRKSSHHTHCANDNNILPSKQTEGVKLAGQIANDITKDLAPYYIYFEVRLLNNPDVYYSIKQKANLKLALELIEKQKYKYANKILLKLNKELNFKSYVALYDLGLSYEVLGQLEKSYKYYQQANDIAILEQQKQIDDIDIALKRVKQTLEELNKINTLNTSKQS